MLYWLVFFIRFFFKRLRPHIYREFYHVKCHPLEIQRRDIFYAYYLHYVKHEYFAILCPRGFSTYGMKRSQFKSILECEFTSAAFWNEGLFANRADGRSDTRRELQGQWTASCHDCVTAGMRGTIIKLSNNKNCTWISLSELGHYMQGNGMTRTRILLNFSHDSSLSRPYQISRRQLP
jgi:hypothetical protein